MNHIFLLNVPIPTLPFVIVLLSTLLVCVPLAINAQVPAPITSSGMNTQVSSAVTLPHGQTQYNITGGTRPGGGANLFHSFGDFNVPTNNLANFLNSGSVGLNGVLLPSNLATSNILGRVTGGNVSSIQGMIQTTGFGAANLFLLNPAGFLFGPNATVNIGGMMTFATADYLKLADGARFNAIPNATADALLTASPVAAFGFLGSNPSAINFEGAQLTVAGGTGVAFIGGEINLVPESSGTPSSVTSPGTPIVLTSVAGPGEVAAETGIPSVGTALGTITFGQGTTLSTANDLSFGDGSGGAISIRAGQFVANGASIFTNPAFGSTGQGGAVTIVATGPASFTDSFVDTHSDATNGGGGPVSIFGSDLTLQNTTIMTSLFGDGVTPLTGGGGAITLTATNGSFSATDSALDTSAFSAGSGGALTLTGTESVTLIRSNIHTDVFFPLLNENSNAGAVTVAAPVIFLEDSFVSTQVEGDGITPITADSGAVTVSGTTSVSLLRSSIVTDSFESQGNSGAVTITAPTVTIVGDPGVSITTGTHNFSGDPNAGNGGDIVITATETDVTFDEAHLESTAEGFGLTQRGGRISISAPENILLENGTSFLTSTNGTGNAGTIELMSQHVTIREQSSLSSSTHGAGSAGTVKITGTNTVALESSSTIFTTAEFDQGPAGHIEINTPQLTIIGGSRLRSDSTSSGQGGIVTVQGISGPAQSVLIDGFGSGIFTDTQGTGAGGSISINANAVTLQNGGTLSATTSGNEITATGGTITVLGDQIALRSGAVITSSTSGAGDGGRVTLHANESILLVNSTIASNSESLGEASSGNGGQVKLTAPNITLDQGSALLAQTTGSGNAGTIEVNTNTLSLADMSLVQTSTQGPGSANSITVQGLAGSGSKAQSVSLASGSALSSNSFGNDDGEGGAAGNILVETQSLGLSGGSQITTSSIFSPGDAGTITINAGTEIQLAQGILSSRSESNIPDEFVNDYVIGNAGTINLSAPTVTLRNQSLIASTTDSRYTGDPSKGNAGSVTINAINLTISEGSQLTSSSIIGDSAKPSVGNAGNVTVQGLVGPAQSVLIDGSGSGIFTDTQGIGSGGSISINANAVTLQNGGALSAVTSGTVSTATGGTITVDANQVQLNSGGLLTASTTGAGSGGSININAGSSFGSNAGTVSSTATQATGGDINISAGQSVTLDNGSVITASSSGEGNAGNIQINAGQQYRSVNSSVTTKAEQASGGNIAVLATGLVHLTNSEINASVEGSTTTVGGNILIDPVYVILENSQILAQATQGQGGNINIFYTGALLADPSTFISASSQFGQQGTVTIQSPISPASGKIIPLGQKPLIPATLLSQRCAALAGGSISSFTVAGRDGLPAEPGNWLSTPLALGSISEANALQASSERDAPLLSLRRIAPPGFLRQTFGVDSTAGCRST